MGSQIQPATNKAGGNIITKDGDFNGTEYGPVVTFTNDGGSLEIPEKTTFTNFGKFDVKDAVKFYIDGTFVNYNTLLLPCLPKSGTKGMYNVSGTVENNNAISVNQPCPPPNNRPINWWYLQEGAHLSNTVFAGRGSGSGIDLKGIELVMHPYSSATNEADFSVSDGELHNFTNTEHGTLYISGPGVAIRSEFINNNNVYISDNADVTVANEGKSGNIFNNFGSPPYNVSIIEIDNTSTFTVNEGGVINGPPKAPPDISEPSWILSNSGQVVIGQGATFYNYNLFANEDNSKLEVNGLFINDALYGQPYEPGGEISSGFINQKDATITIGATGSFDNIGYFESYPGELINKGILTNNLPSAHSARNDSYVIVGQLQNSGRIDNQQGWMTFLADYTPDGKLINAAKIVNDGTIFIKNGAGIDTVTAPVDPKLTDVIFYNDPKSIVNNQGVFGNWGTFKNAGMVSNIGGTFEQNGAFENLDGGTLTIQGNGSNFTNFANPGFPTPSFVNQEGAKVLIESGTFVNYINLNNMKGADINALNGTFINKNGGKISGEGTFHGVKINQGTISPGDVSQSAGVYYINGDLKQKKNSTKEIELGGTFDGDGGRTATDYDRIEITGDLKLAGDLSVSLIDNYKLSKGDSFLITRVGKNLSGTYDGLKEGASVGRFANSKGGKSRLYITYKGGDGNDIVLSTRLAERDYLIERDEIKGFANKNITSIVFGNLSDEWRNGTKKASINRKSIKNAGKWKHIENVQTFKGLETDFIQFSLDTSHGLSYKQILKRLFKGNVFESFEMNQEFNLIEPITDII